jgi:uncharacterized protein YqjF (DUF2071 family)
MVQWWDDVTFIHWRVSPEQVQRLLPRGLTVQTFDDTAWVGLVPFFLRVGLPRLPSVPWFSRFPETNVRTYVRTEDGTSGVWFFSLDAARLGAVVVARTTYRLPYFWSQMSIERSESRIHYRCNRRWPRPIASSAAIVDIGQRYEVGEMTSLDHFLTARWMLFSAPRTGLRRARAFHEPWPLHRAHIVELDDTLVTAAGFPAPQGQPLVHFAPSVAVRIGWPQRVRRSEPLGLGS